MMGTARPRGYARNRKHSTNETTVRGTTNMAALGMQLCLPTIFLMGIIVHTVDETRITFTTLDGMD